MKAIKYWLTIFIVLMIVSDCSYASALSASWSQTSGPATGTIGNSATPSTTFTAPSAGSYNLRITLSDETPPVPVAGDDISADEDSVVSFDGSGSSDNVCISMLSWDFDNSDGYTNDATSVTTNHTYATPGVYVVTLTVGDTSGNMATDTLNVTVNDITPPVQSEWSPGASATIFTTSQVVTFTTDEDAYCRWSLSDTAYDSMIDNCSGGGTTSQSCATSGLSDGENVLYLACQDMLGNADSADTNTSLGLILFDGTPPEQSNWSPAKDSHLNTASATITFNTNENADCKWSLSDDSYGSMEDDCSGDGTTSQSCSVTGLPDGAWTVYTACRDTSGNSDTIGSNEHIDYVIDTTPPDFTGIKDITTCGSGCLDITWEAASDALSVPISYNLYYSTTAGGQNFSSANVTTSATSTQMTGLIDAQMYYFIVRAEDSIGNEDPNTKEVSAKSGIYENPWITIPAGDFVMGCADADTDCGAEESPKHTVTLSEYRVQKFEVTNAQYRQCVEDSICTAPSDYSSFTHPSYYDNTTYDNYPVLYVNRERSSAYCEWLRGRLATEAEWEKAARGPYPRELIFPWGDNSLNCSMANGDVDGSPCVGDTTEVGSYPSGMSYYGAYDMAGNVLEYTNDYLDTSYYSNGGPPWVDPRGPDSGTTMAFRGGSWRAYSLNTLRASGRPVIGGVNSLTWYIGFRCAQDTIKDFTPPAQSNWSPIKSATLTVTVPTVTFTTNEDSDCKWSLTDDDYETMSGDCTGDGTTSQSCSTSGLIDGDEIVYISCRDAAGNADNEYTNEHINYFVDTTPPDFTGIKDITTCGSGCLDITWEEATDAGGSTPITYNLYYSTTSDGQNFSSPDVATTATYTRITGITDGIDYFFIARAEDSLGHEDTNTKEVTAKPGIYDNPWITIPAGDFVMGCADADTDCDSDESPKHTVTLSEYRIQKYEVTNAQYRECEDQSVCPHPWTHAGQDDPITLPEYDNHPVMFVKWDYSVTYCGWLNGRLPTEAEWEKAARGPFPRENIYPWGDDQPTCTLANMIDSCNSGFYSYQRTDPVGSHPSGASYYGLMDVSGNWYEHTNDIYSSTYYSTGGPPWIDPQGSISGSNRTLRSHVESGDMRISNRSSVDVAINVDPQADGIRCAQDTIDTSPPNPSNFNPTPSSSIVTKSPTITFTLNEVGDCKWSLSDQDYSSMTNDCTGDGTKNQSCVTSGLVEGAEIVYIACQDVNGNADTVDTNEHVNYIVDLTPPVQSNWNPAKSAAITTASPVITLTTNENADCKWSLSDLAYDSMTGDCAGDGTTSQSCATSGLVNGAEIVYIACRDTVLNADTIAFNTHVDYTVSDTTPPEQSNWSPAKSALINTTSPAITFNTDENADCKWSLSDLAYASMSGDCTGDGTTSQSCSVSGIVPTSDIVYTACRDTNGNADTVDSNEHIDYTIDNSPPIQSNWNPTPGSTLTSTSQVITFNTNENADCKWSLSDQAYSSMTNDCTGDGTTSQSCSTYGLVNGIELVYIACRDTAGNEDSIATNSNLDYDVDTLPPTQSNWNPAKSANITTTSPTITFNTDESADCKWALSDKAYSFMTGDCTGDGTTSQSCVISGLIPSADTIYIACRDDAGNEDTIATNEHVSYTIGSAGPVCPNGVLETGEWCDDGNTNPISPSDTCAAECQYIEYPYTQNFNQRDCETLLESMYPGNGMGIAKASSGIAATTQLLKYYPDAGNLYDCTTVNSIFQQYLAYDPPTSVSTFMSAGVDGQKLCNWLNSTSNLSVTCSYQTNVTIDTLKETIKTGPFVLMLQPFYDDAGNWLCGNLNHFIDVRGYDGDIDRFVVNDSLGNANMHSCDILGWGYDVTNYGALLSYDLETMMGYAGINAMLVIRDR